MPYWTRQAVLTRNLENYRKLYGDIEIIVVDDGSPEPAVVDPQTKLIRLPDKQYALNPCIPINTGVNAALGDVIVITNPEVIHRTAILERMLDELEARSYVAAACWSEDHRAWFCHSIQSPDLGRAPIPAGAGLHFCSAICRSFYMEIGGFSEEYRNGQGFEDNDFLWKLHRAKATFKIVDDCVTDHVSAPRSQWRGGSNEALFYSKWPNLSGN